MEALGPGESWSKSPVKSKSNRRFQYGGFWFSAVDSVAGILDGQLVRLVEYQSSASSRRHERLPQKVPGPWAGFSFDFHAFS